MSTTAKSSFVWPETAAPQPQPAAEAWHTPTPWHVDNCPSGFIYINAGTARIARIEDQKYMTEAHAQADAEQIALAVNAHAALVARVSELEAALDAARVALVETTLSLGSEAQIQNQKEGTLRDAARVGGVAILKLDAARDALAAGGGK